MLLPKKKQTKNILSILAIIFILVYFSFIPFVQAQTREHQASIFLSPAVQTILTDSTFDVSIFVNTYGNSINLVKLDLKFPPDKLIIVKPSSGKSFISLWSEVPTYSNVKGTASFVGGIPGGITTESGLLTTITFRAKSIGQAIIEVLPSSKVLANDGLGTDILTRFDRGIYTLNPKPPEGPKVFSGTHRFEDHWYNNNSPVIFWEKEQNVTDFSFKLDNKPLTIPDNVAETEDTLKSYEDLSDGLWYFHIKARKEGVWGSTTHFILYIDTAPPNPFTPKIELLTAALSSRALVTFFTTDTLSGIDHYEVGIIDKTKLLTELPVFIETQSPYPLPVFTSGDLRVIVRAVDNADNVRDESVEAYVPSILSFIKSNLELIIITILVIALVLIIIVNYLFRNKFINRFKKAYKIFKKVKEDQIQEDQVQEVKKDQIQENQEVKEDQEVKKDQVQDPYEERRY